MPRIPGWLFYVVTLTVIGLWAAGLIVSMVSPSFELPPSLSAAVPIVLVGLYTAKANDDSARRQPPPPAPPTGEDDPNG